MGWRYKDYETPTPVLFRPFPAPETTRVSIGLHSFWAEGRLSVDEESWFRSHISDPIGGLNAHSIGNASVSYRFSRGVNLAHGSLYRQSPPYIPSSPFRSRATIAYHLRLPFLVTQYSTSSVCSPVLAEPGIELALQGTSSANFSNIAKF